MCAGPGAVPCGLNHPYAYKPEIYLYAKAMWVPFGTDVWMVLSASAVGALLGWYFFGLLGAILGAILGGVGFVYVFMYYMIHSS
jgi:hypothetical protein